MDAKAVMPGGLEAFSRKQSVRLPFCPFSVKDNIIYVCDHNAIDALDISSHDEVKKNRICEFKGRPNGFDRMFSHVPHQCRINVEAKEPLAISHQGASSCVITYNGQFYPYHDAIDAPDSIKYHPMRESWFAYTDQSGVELQFNAVSNKFTLINSFRVNMRPADVFLVPAGASRRMYIYTTSRRNMAGKLRVLDEKFSDYETPIARFIGICGKSTQNDDMLFYDEDTLHVLRLDAATMASRTARVFPLKYIRAIASVDDNMCVMSHDVGRDTCNITFGDLRTSRPVFTKASATVCISEYSGDRLYVSNASGHLRVYLRYNCWSLAIFE